MNYTSYLYQTNYNNPIPSGVYAIVNVVAYSLYVGSTVNFTQRMGQHFKALEEGIHHNRRLQHSFDAHGASSFSFVVLERVPDRDRLEGAEQRWLDRLQHLALNSQGHVRRVTAFGIPEAEAEPVPW